MLSDFMPIKHKIDGNDDITLYLIGDVHIGAKEFDAKRFNDTISKVEADDNARIILVGDIINNATRSSISNVFDEVFSPSESKLLAANYLKPVKDKILAAVGGNHEMRSVREVDDDPAYDIMCKLNIENLYRRNAAFVKIQIGDVKGAGQRNPTYTLFVTHGSGGGTTPGAGANKQHKVQAIYEGIDVFIQGHTHKAINFFPQRITYDKHNNKVTRRTVVCVTVPSFLDYGGYAMRFGLAPFANVASTIKLCGSKKLISCEQIAEY